MNAFVGCGSGAHTNDTTAECQEAERLRQQQVQEENIRQRQLRDEMRRKEEQEVLRKLEEHKKKLEAEERARQEALENKVQHLRKIGEKWEREGAGKKEREEREREDARVCGIAAPLSAE